jgi:transposase
MHIVGIDLGVKGSHKAIVANENGQIISGVLKFRTEIQSLGWLLEQAQKDNPDGRLQAVMEPTGMAWFAVAVFLIRQGVRVYLVNSQQVADLRRYFKKHAKSDRIDARVLAKLPLVDPEKLHPLELPTAAMLGCQRGCKQLERLVKQRTAAKNRLIALDRFAWPGLEERVFGETFGCAARWFRRHWYHPAKVIQAGVEAIRQDWMASHLDPEDPGAWGAALVQLAGELLEIYGAEDAYLDYAILQDEAIQEQDLLSYVEERHHRIQHKIVQPLYRQIHPQRHLESLVGVGPDSAAVFASFIGNPERFDSTRQLRGWSGMVPNSKQSSLSQVSGLKITQAGPRLIKKFAFLDAEVARQWDPQMAAIYYEQMVKHGKHHTQAICTCATHLLDRVLVVLRENRAYQLRDVDGSPVSKEQAQTIIAQRYTVPEEIRRRNNKGTRQERVEQQAEKKSERESRTVPTPGRSKRPKPVG